MPAAGGKPRGGLGIQNQPGPACTVGRCPAFQEGV